MLVAMSLLTACVVLPERRGHGPERVMIAPMLPPLVVLDIEPFYFHNGFHYHYVNDRWFYARSKNGPWAALPRDRYPKEVRFKSRDHDNRDNDRRHDNRDNDRRHDNRDNDRRHDNRDHEGRYDD